MKDIDIIYYTLFPWDNAYSSVSLSFTREFAKHHRVFYVNPAFTYKDLITRRADPRVQSRLRDQLRQRVRYETIPNLPENVIAMQPPSVLPINWLPKGGLHQRLQARNDQVIFRAIQQMIQKYDIRNYIYLNCFNPAIAGVLPKSLQPRLNIYQCIDDMWQEAYTAKHWAHKEEQVIAVADIAVVTSRQLHALKQPFNPNTYILHNAVDATIFSQAVEKKLPVPADIAHIKNQMIGFTGNMDGSRIDYPLLRKIADRYPDKTLVLVGPTNSEDYQKVGLHQLPNVVFTGSKPIQELPAYLQQFDCTIIPFLCNALTASIYPLKINEYLFAGKPVVATNFSTDIQSFKDVVYLATDHEAFLQQIEQAIQEDQADRKQGRVAVAQSNTWTRRVEQFWAIVERHLG